MPRVLVVLMLLVSEALRGGDDGYEVGVHVGMAPAGEVRSLAATAQAASRIHLPCSGMIFLFHLRVWLRLGWINGPPPSAQQHFRIGSFSFMEKRSGEGRWAGANNHRHCGCRWDTRNVSIRSEKLRDKVTTSRAPCV